MEASLFFKAMLIGLSIAAPVGPIGLLCIQRTLAHGMRTGFVSGMGAACADAVYGAIGAFGMVAVTDYFISLSTPLAIGGALFLGWMGVKLLLTKNEEGQAASVGTQKTGKAFISVFVLTLANPMTIISFIAVFASIAGPKVLGHAAAGLMVVGVFLGSAIWWLMLSAGVALLSRQVGAGVLGLINRLGGLLLLGFALWQILQILQNLQVF
ncbi:LysE family translocator [Undibacterium pigrum]|uniref:Threonine/homoserine/homoserine lactone efflux protein n=1 Tax=Undibacterium pigrum TaxID=401470 RepID=A0A318J880_9BURK|nr:LysE family transporter [Undibacterium pigrum]PXX42636.1 threonine/homoserine/homoserine lactone efflux protein [Undibacterium pigrum]